MILSLIILVENSYYHEVFRAILQKTQLLTKYVKKDIWVEKNLGL